jgi:hypothetical protein
MMFELDPTKLDKCGSILNLMSTTSRLLISVVERVFSFLPFGV